MPQSYKPGDPARSQRATGKDRPVPDASVAPVLDLGQSVSVRTSKKTASGLFVASASRSPEVIEDPYEDFLTEARERFGRVASYESQWRKDAREEIEFTDGLKHWDEAMRAERQGRPCLTFDRITPAIKNVVNNTKQSPPEPEVIPVGGGADKETAQVIQGLFRNIDNDSGADTVFMTAFEHACKIGRGWWRILFDWETDHLGEDPHDLSPDLMLQKIKLQRIPNPFSVYPDPACMEFDYSDMEYLFATEDIDRKVFRELYEDAADATLLMADRVLAPNEGAGAGDVFESVGDRIKSDWFPNGTIRVAEYWYKVRTKKTIHKLESGMIVDDDHLFDAIPVITRELFETKIYCAKITGASVIKRWEWPGRSIPFVPVIGDEIWKNGKRTVRGMIRPAMDANLSYDFMRSKQAESIALAPIAPVMAAFGSIGQWESMWADANRKAYAVLPYLAWDKDNNRQFPEPKRLNTADAQVQAITLAIAHAENDIEAMTQTYKPDLGAPSSETSGRAISLRQREGDKAHFNYHDNLARSQRRTALIELELVPVVYSEERLIAISDPDQHIRSVQINKQFLDKGVQSIYDLAKVGGAQRYDVVMKSGPSYATRREQGAAMMSDLIKFMPGPMARALDLYIGMLDIPVDLATQLAARLRPADVPSDDGGPSMQQLTAQNKQMQALIQQLSQSVNTLSDKVMAERLKLASQERVAIHGDFAGILESLIKAKSSGQEALLGEVAELYRQREQILATSQETANPDSNQSSPGASPSQGQPPTAAPPGAAGAPPASPAAAPAQVQQ